MPPSRRQRKRPAKEPAEAKSTPVKRGKSVAVTPTKKATAFNVFPVDKDRLSVRISYEKLGILHRDPPSRADAGMKSVRRDERMPLSSEQLDKAKKVGEQSMMAPATAIRQAFERHTPVPVEMTPAQFGSASYPMYPAAPSPLDPFMIAFASANIHGQAELMGARLKNEYMRLELLRQQVEKEIKGVNGRITSLKNEWRHYREKNEVFEGIEAAWEARTTNN